MKYIRTKDGKIGKVISVKDYNVSIPTFYHVQFANDKEIYNDYELDIIAKTDTIEELCDDGVIIDLNGKHTITYYLKEKKCWLMGDRKYISAFYGAIWTDKGLIYVAKMNDKGELELL